MKASTLRKIAVAVMCCLVAVAARSVKDQPPAAGDALAAYIAGARSELEPRFRLHYHLMPPVGWMNDPNGFSYYNGQFHMFYQFYPYDSVWGPMHWGHSISSDLVHWEELPTALIPENEMCFSGSAVDDDGVLTLIYTGRETIAQEPFYREGQYLAFSDDGVNFHKYKGNPVLPAAPNGSPDFRDPKVWKHGDYWYLIVGSKTSDERGRVLLYKSKDLKEWEFLTVLGESNGDMGYMWECPDFFELDGKFVLLMSPQGLEAKGDRFKNTYQTGYIIGTFNYTTYEFIQEVDFQEIDYGHDFYATQTLEHEGERYLVAWFSMWEVPHPEADDGWAGALTIVRQLELRDNQIIMRPVEEIVQLREEFLMDGELHSDEETELPRATELIVLGDLSEDIELLLEGVDGGDAVRLRWEARSQHVVVERGGDERRASWRPARGATWRLFLDASSLELFCGEGEAVFSTRAYPLGGWRLTNRSRGPLHVQAFRLGASVPT
ncbi:unnamed protein product [Leptidea sinapis]|uniref:Sucrose-6-phosphate hydrolase n=1 Tax=Leptidea sinapis TaxID=189913 RepID=A0A5E4R5F1_9NEOP|nr:unnamed protein product [Leptidea sinapis]